MTKELEALKNIKGTIISSTRGDWGFEYRHVGDIESIKKHLDIIEQALKRNEPMKPQTKTYTNGFFMRRACSVCDTTIQKEFVYCPYCGQKLDWSDEE